MIRPLMAPSVTAKLRSVNRITMNTPESRKVVIRNKRFQLEHAFAFGG